jgi:hypothetical protein
MTITNIYIDVIYADHLYWSLDSDQLKSFHFILSINVQI